MRNQDFVTYMSNSTKETRFKLYNQLFDFGLNLRATIDDFSCVTCVKLRPLSNRVISKYCRRSSYRITKSTKSSYSRQALHYKIRKSKVAPQNISCNEQLKYVISKTSVEPIKPIQILNSQIVLSRNSTTKNKHLQRTKNSNKILQKQNLTETNVNSSPTEHNIHMGNRRETNLSPPKYQQDLNSRIIAISGGKNESRKRIGVTSTCNTEYLQKTPNFTSNIVLENNNVKCDGNVQNNTKKVMKYKYPVTESANICVPNLKKNCIRNIKVKENIESNENQLKVQKYVGSLNSHTKQNVETVNPKVLGGKLLSVVMSKNKENKRKIETTKMANDKQDERRSTLKRKHNSVTHRFMTNEASADDSTKAVNNKYTNSDKICILVPEKILKLDHNNSVNKSRVENIGDEQNQYSSATETRMQSKAVKSNLTIHKKDSQMENGRMTPIKRTCKRKFEEDNLIEVEEESKALDIQIPEQNLCTEKHFSEVQESTENLLDSNESNSQYSKNGMDNETINSCDEEHQTSMSINSSNYITFGDAIEKYKSKIRSTKTVDIDFVEPLALTDAVKSPGFSKVFKDTHLSVKNINIASICSNKAIIKTVSKSNARLKNIQNYTNIVGQNKLPYKFKNVSEALQVLKTKQNIFDKQQDQQILEIESHKEECLEVNNEVDISDSIKNNSKAIISEALRAFSTEENIIYKQNQQIDEIVPQNDISLELNNKNIPASNIPESNKNENKGNCTSEAIHALRIEHNIALKQNNQIQVIESLNDISSEVNNKSISSVKNIPKSPKNKNDGNVSQVLRAQQFIEEEDQNSNQQIQEIESKNDVSLQENNENLPTVDNIKQTIKNKYNDNVPKAVNLLRTEKDITESENVNRKQEMQEIVSRKTVCKKDNKKKTLAADNMPESIKSKKDDNGSVASHSMRKIQHVSQKQVQEDESQNIIGLTVNKQYILPADNIPEPTKNINNNNNINIEEDENDFSNVDLPEMPNSGNTNKPIDNHKSHLRKDNNNSLDSRKKCNFKKFEKEEILVDDNIPKPWDFYLRYPNLCKKVSAPIQRKSANIKKKILDEKQNKREEPKIYKSGCNINGHSTLDCSLEVVPVTSKVKNIVSMMKESSLQNCDNIERNDNQTNLYPKNYAISAINTKSTNITNNYMRDYISYIDKSSYNNETNTVKQKPYSNVSENSCSQKVTTISNRYTVSKDYIEVAESATNVNSSDLNCAEEQQQLVLNLNDDKQKNDLNACRGSKNSAPTSTKGAVNNTINTLSTAHNNFSVLSQNSGKQFYIIANQDKTDNVYPVLNSTATDQFQDNQNTLPARHGETRSENVTETDSEILNISSLNHDTTFANPVEDKLRNLLIVSLADQDIVSEDIVDDMITLCTTDDNQEKNLNNVSTHTNIDTTIIVEDRIENNSENSPENVQSNSLSNHATTVEKVSLSSAATASCPITEVTRQEILNISSSEQHILPENSVQARRDATLNVSSFIEGTVPADMESREQVLDISNEATFLRRNGEDILNVSLSVQDALSLNTSQPEKKLNKSKFPLNTVECRTENNLNCCMPSHNILPKVNVGNTVKNNKISFPTPKFEARSEHTLNVLSSKAVNNIGNFVPEDVFQARPGNVLNISLSNQNIISPNTAEDEPVNNVDNVLPNQSTSLKNGINSTISRNCKAFTMNHLLANDVEKENKQRNFKKFEKLQVLRPDTSERDFRNRTIAPELATLSLNMPQNNAHISKQPSTNFETPPLPTPVLTSRESANYIITAFLLVMKDLIQYHHLTKVITDLNRNRKEVAQSISECSQRYIFHVEKLYYVLKSVKVSDFNINIFLEQLLIVSRSIFRNPLFEMKQLADMWFRTMAYMKTKYLGTNDKSSLLDQVLSHVLSVTIPTSVENNVHYNTQRSNATNKGLPKINVIAGRGRGTTTGRGVARGRSSAEARSRGEARDANRGGGRGRGTGRGHSPFVQSTSATTFLPNNNSNIHSAVSNNINDAHSETRNAANIPVLIPNTVNPKPNPTIPLVPASNTSNSFNLIESAKQTWYPPNMLTRNAATTNISNSNTNNPVSYPTNRNLQAYEKRSTLPSYSESLLNRGHFIIPQNTTIPFQQPINNQCPNNITIHSILYMNDASRSLQPAVTNQSHLINYAVPQNNQNEGLQIQNRYPGQIFQQPNQINQFPSLPPRSDIVQPNNNNTLHYQNAINNKKQIAQINGISPMLNQPISNCPTSLPLPTAYIPFNYNDVVRRPLELLPNQTVPHVLNHLTSVPQSNENHYNQPQAVNNLQTKYVNKQITDNLKVLNQNYINPQSRPTNRINNLMVNQSRSVGASKASNGLNTSSEVQMNQTVASNQTALSYSQIPCNYQFNMNGSAVNPNTLTTSKEITELEKLLQMHSSNKTTVPRKNFNNNYNSVPMVTNTAYRSNEHFQMNAATTIPTMNLPVSNIQLPLSQTVTQSNNQIINSNGYHNIYNAANKGRQTYQNKSVYQTKARTTVQGLRPPISNNLPSISHNITTGGKPITSSASEVNTNVNNYSAPQPHWNRIDSNNEYNVQQRAQFTASNSLPAGNYTNCYANILRHHQAGTIITSTLPANTSSLYRPNEIQPTPTHMTRQISPVNLARNEKDSLYCGANLDRSVNSNDKTTPQHHGPPVSEGQPNATHFTISNSKDTSRNTGVVTTSKDTDESFCSNCLGPGNFICSGCCKTYYCSVECQGAAWENHLQECQVG